MKLSEQIVKVVRGDAHWSSLQSLGVRVQKEPERWTWQMPPPLANPIAAKASDLAVGALKFIDKPAELKEWSSFLLAASSLVTFDALEKSPHGESLLNALWDVSSSAEAGSELRQIAEAAQYENE